MFAVFGKSKVLARGKALDQIDAQANQATEEFSNEVERRADEIYSKMKPGRLSPIYSVRKHAEHFKDMMIEQSEPKDIGKLKIKQAYRESNEANPKTGRPYPLRWK